MLPQRFVVASCYHRIMYTPAPVLVFRPRPGTHASLHPCRSALNERRVTEPNQPQPLLAAGSLMEANPNRLLIKRIVLTGHPVHCMRRFAVVRFMFFNADDIRWFKPVEVWTKHGAPAQTSGHRDRCLQVTDPIAPVRARYRPGGPHSGASRHEGLHEVPLQRQHQATRCGLHVAVQAAVPAVARRDALKCSGNERVRLT